MKKLWINVSILTRVQLNYHHHHHMSMLDEQSKNKLSDVMLTHEQPYSHLLFTALSQVEIPYSFGRGEPLLTPPTGKMG